MNNNFRKHPLTCLMISICKLLIGRLNLRNEFVNDRIIMDNESTYQIFRHIAVKESNSCNPSHIVFIVSFKFAHLSHKANRIASIVPMLLIAGFPGFVKKIYAVNHENGYWQGMYQWASLESLEEYKNSFIFRIMNKRAKQESISLAQFENQDLDSFIRDRMK